MTITQFYETLKTLTIEAPTHEIAELALSLQTAIDNLTRDEFDDLQEIIPNEIV